MTAFRLATLERLRAAKLESAGREVQRAIVALGAIRSRIEDLSAALDGAVTPRVTSPAGLTAVGAHREQLRHELEAAGVELTARELDLDRARADWGTARSQLRAVNALHDRHREAVRMERLRTEQLELDDLAGSRGRGPAHGTAAGRGGRRA